MIVTQTVDIPASRRIFLDLPLHLPVGKAKLALTVTPEPVTQEKTVKPLSAFFGVDKELDTMDAYFARKQADKALEDARFERSLRKAK